MASGHAHAMYSPVWATCWLGCRFYRFVHVTRTNMSFRHSPRPLLPSFQLLCGSFGGLSCCWFDFGFSSGIFGHSLSQKCPFPPAFLVDSVCYLGFLLGLGREVQVFSLFGHLGSKKRFQYLRSEVRQVSDHSEGPIFDFECHMASVPVPQVGYSFTNRVLTP